MLSGVLFHTDQDGSIHPYFNNRYVITDVLLATPSTASRPIIPSIATLSSPTTSLLRTLYEVLRSLTLCLLTWIPFTWSLAKGKGTQRLSRISVANTSIYHHDGKFLAGCESGPPMRIMLPKMETAGWWTGDEGRSWGASGIGPMKLFEEMTTAHPHTDESNKELLLYHSSFVAPYLRVSVIPPRASRRPALIGATVPGMKEGKLMHDFAASRTRTVVMDLPLSLDPRNLLKNKPIVDYSPKAAVRFGVFPRRRPEQVTWYTDPTACCIYHTANCWDEEQQQEPEEEDAINFLACRLNSATLVYSAGNVPAPESARPPIGQKERCELYYWRFASPPPAEDLALAVTPSIASATTSSPFFTDEKSNKTTSSPRITHAFPLSVIPFEFPTINLSYAPAAGLGPNQFVYGCSMREGSFDAGMGRNSAKIDCLVKMDVKSLVRKGRAGQNKQDEGLSTFQHGEAVDNREVTEILESQREGQSGQEDIKVFSLPPGHYAQESTFLPRANPKSEDDGFLLFFVFDESSPANLDPVTGHCLPGATSELWILDARDMQTIVARVKLPKRVPYGLHGRWFDAGALEGQEKVDEEMIRQWTLREEEGKMALVEKNGVAAATREKRVEQVIKGSHRNGPAMLRKLLEWVWA